MKRRAALSLLVCSMVALGACAPAQTASDPIASQGETASVGVSSEGEAAKVEAQELKVSQKIVPGCRNTLPYPLKMKGNSEAVDFSRWSAVDLDGNLVDQEVLRDSELTLVHVWATYCGGHMEDLRILQELYETYDRSQLNVIGILASAQYEDGEINRDEVEYVKYLLGETGAEFLQVLPSDDLIQIKLKDLGIVPESFLLDKEGKQVGESWIGSRTAAELRQMIDDALPS